jgi:hypothetical protein
MNIQWLKDELPFANVSVTYNDDNIHIHIISNVCQATLITNNIDVRAIRDEFTHRHEKISRLRSKLKGFIEDLQKTGTHIIIDTDDVYVYIEAFGLRARILENDINEQTLRTIGEPLVFEHIKHMFEECVKEYKKNKTENIEHQIKKFMAVGFPCVDEQIIRKQKEKELLMEEVLRSKNGIGGLIEDKIRSFLYYDPKQWKS